MRCACWHGNRISEGQTKMHQAMIIALVMFLGLTCLGYVFWNGLVHLGMVG